MSEYDDNLMNAELENLDAENFDLKDTVKWLQRQVDELKQTLQHREKEIEELVSGMISFNADHAAAMAAAADREKGLREEVTFLRSLAMVMADRRFEEQQ